LVAQPTEVLVTYLAGPTAAAINGEVFVVLDAIASALAGFETGPSGAGFGCEDTMALASDTIGFRPAGGR
jgi:hypothetical protein